MPLPLCPACSPPVSCSSPTALGGLQPLPVAFSLAYLPSYIPRLSAAPPCFHAQVALFPCSCTSRLPSGPLWRCPAAAHGGFPSTPEVGSCSAVLALAASHKPPPAAHLDHGCPFLYNGVLALVFSLFLAAALLSPLVTAWLGSFSSPHAAHQMAHLPPGHHAFQTDGAGASFLCHHAAR
ncbi:hypothetical protein GOP47_0028115 [Adiantum capillus-veneris]|nr:hypothetical protein GOP47_0028115 [Adiantum capillus-veneris]